MTNPSCQSREKKEENNDTGLSDFGKGQSYLELSIKLLGRLLDHFSCFPEQHALSDASQLTVII